MKKLTALLVGVVLVNGLAFAQSSSPSDKQAKIKSAMSAAPDVIANKATIKDWPSVEGGEMTLLREGTNGFTCLPDMPDTPGNDPMCLDEAWMQWAEAWMNKADFKATKMGFGYMLQGGTPESNIDPYAEGPTDDNEWLSDADPHLMIIVPDLAALEGLPVKPEGGGPWVMWRNTPYVHIMVPMPRHNPGAMAEM